MGRVRTKTVKNSAKKVVERYYTSLSNDFYANKRAGWVTHLMRRIERGPVKGISIKLQEEERERRDNYVPAQSALEKESVLVSDTMIQMIEDARVPIPPNYLQ